MVCATSKGSYAYAQPDQSLCLSLEYSMSAKLLTKHHLDFLSLKGAAHACPSLHLSNATLLEITRHGSDVQGVPKGMKRF